jgi:hypothetical protein
VLHVRRSRIALDLRKRKEWRAGRDSNYLWVLQVVKLLILQFAAGASFALLTVSRHKSWYRTGTESNISEMKCLLRWERNELSIMNTLESLHELFTEHHDWDISILAQGPLVILRGERKTHLPGRMNVAYEAFDSWRRTDENHVSQKLAVFKRRLAA